MGHRGQTGHHIQMVHMGQMFMGQVFNGLTGHIYKSPHSDGSHGSDVLWVNGSNKSPHSDGPHGSHIQWVNGYVGSNKSPISDGSRVTLVMRQLFHGSVGRAGQTGHQIHMRHRSRWSLLSWSSSGSLHSDKSHSTQVTCHKKIKNIRVRLLII